LRKYFWVFCRFSRWESFRRSAKIVFLHGSAESGGGAKIQFLHSGAAVKPYPGETFQYAETGGKTNPGRFSMPGFTAFTPACPKTIV
jgi:hypothetical protein